MISARAQQVLQKSTDFLRRFIAPHTSFVCPHCHRYPHGDCTWWVSLGLGHVDQKKKKKQCEEREQSRSFSGRCGSQ